MPAQNLFDLDVLERNGLIIVSMMGCEPCVRLKAVLADFSIQTGREVAVVELRPSVARELVRSGDVTAFPSTYWKAEDGQIAVVVGDFAETVPEIIARLRRSGDA